MQLRSPGSPASGTQGQYSSTDARDRHGLSWLLDASIRLPGGFRIGLDGLLGLIPGVGDAIAGGLSTWMLYQAYKLNVPKIVMVRMVINIIIDSVLGAIPIVGDIFDFFFKANLKNARLLDEYRAMPQKTRRNSLWMTVVFLVGLLVIGFVVIYALVALAALIWQRVTAGA